jgi:hypothetical protein
VPIFHEVAQYSDEYDRLKLGIPTSGPRVGSRTKCAVTQLRSSTIMAKSSRLGRLPEGTPAFGIVAEVGHRTRHADCRRDY